MLIETIEGSDDHRFQLDNGDLIIHKDYGAGRVVGTKQLQLSGETKSYLRVSLVNGDVWLPRDKCNPEWLRPLANLGDIERALLELKEPVRPLPDNKRARQLHLNDVTAHSSPDEIVAMLRDLWASHRASHGLTGHEKKTWDRLHTAFLAEWSACSGATFKEVETQFQEMLTAD